MAGRTLVNGTVYQIKGGRTLVNGTGYSIRHGKTLVNGVGQTIQLVHVWNRYYVKYTSHYGTVPDDKVCKLGSNGLYAYNAEQTGGGFKIKSYLGHVTSKNRYYQITLDKSAGVWAFSEHECEIGKTYADIIACDAGATGNIYAGDLRGYLAITTSGQYASAVTKYWFTYSRYDNPIDQVVSTDGAAYPGDGLASDGYWYVKQE
nr:MAG TPA: hypothetical protein [Bacteriophage sp.]